MFCESCGAADQSGKFCGKCGSPLTDEPQSAQITIKNRKPQAVLNSSHPLFEYMVLTQKDRLFGGKFNPVLLQNALNELAQHGWRVIEAATTTFPGFSGNREELVFVLERQLS